MYAPCSPIGGYVADRLSKRHVIVVSLLVRSAVTWWTGHVDSFAQLIAARAVMGVSEAVSIPAALAMIADFHRGGTRSRAVGLHQMGIHAGIIVGGFSGYAADSPAVGWRLAFARCGAMGILYAVPLFLPLQNPPPDAAVDDRPALGAALGQLLTNPGFLLTVLSFTLPGIAGWVVKDWMPDILKEKFGLGQGKAGVTAVLYVQIASILGVLLGGWLADTLMSRTSRRRVTCRPLAPSGARA